MATEISVSVDRNPVSMDESFNIFFTAKEMPDGEPDFTPLQKEFTIVNQSQSTSSSWVNGTYNKAIKWTLQVTANKAGRLFLPAIQFGDDTSEPLPITVSQSPGHDTAAQNTDELFLEVKVNPEQPYVQSQVIYTMRLYRRVDVAQAELTEPELADAVVEKLGEDTSFNTVVNGVSYVVTERKYAIFPQKSGKMTIKPLTLTAEVILGGRPSFSDFFGSRMTKTKRVLSKEVVLNVKPVPAEFNGKDWLAAEKLELSEAWSGDTQVMKIGEPLTRTLTLKGIATTVGQLPEMNTVLTDDKLKAYPDQPVLDEQKQTDGLIASRQEKIAIIPSALGEHKLPAVEIPWFNIKTRTMEVAKLPEVTIKVIGAKAGDPSLSNSSQLAVTPNQASEQTGSPTKSVSGFSLQGQGFWPWLSLVLALGWLATVAYFLRNKRMNEHLKMLAEEQALSEYDIKESIKLLKFACYEDDAQAAKQVLLAWGKFKFEADNLAAIATNCDARLRDEILQLNHALYGKNQQDWQGKKLFQAFTENKAREKIAAREDYVLEPLHRI